MPRKKLNNEGDIVAPNEYMLKLLGDIPLEEIPSMSLEGAVASQFCCNIGMSAKEQREKMSNGKTLTFADIEEYVPIDIIIDQEYTLTLNEVLTMPDSTFSELCVIFRNLTKGCKTGISVVVFDDRSSGKYRGLALLRAEGLPLRVISGTCVVRRSEKRHLTLLAGRAYDIFKTLARWRVLRPAWRYDEEAMDALQEDYDEEDEY